MAGLEFDVRPGSGVSKFDIGSSLWTVLEQLRAYRLTFPTVDIKFDPESSTTSPVILHVRPHLDLLFSGHQQRLHTICIRRLRDELHPPLTLRYKDHILCSITEVLRRVDVGRTFGPTYVGDELQYPGIWFTFDEDGRTEPRPIGKHVPLSHGKDRDQEVRRIIISEKDFNRDTRDALDEVRECSIMNGDVRRAVIKVHEGVTLHMYPTTASPVSIELGITTVQDLILDLGRPAQVFYKTDERMKIHSDSSSGADTEADYFYNYFQYGIDCLISGTEHVVKKLVLHTNVVRAFILEFDVDDNQLSQPGTPMFQRYKRCPWEIEGRPEDDEDDSPPRMRFYDAPEAIGHFLNPKEEPQAMIFDRTDDENGVTLSNSGSRLQAYDGIILEVADAGQVTSVTLF